MWRQQKGLIGLCIVWVLMCLASGNLALAQTGTTSLRSTVLDKSGAAVAGATVTLSNSEQGFERSVSSSETGTYEFVGLTPGIYSLMVEEDNFQKFKLNKIQLLVNTPATPIATLQVGSSAQTVEVSATTGTLNTTDASIGSAFNENQIKQLPLEGRSVPELPSLQAGVVYTGNRSDIDKDTDEHGRRETTRRDRTNAGQEARWEREFLAAFCVCEGLVTPLEFTSKVMKSLRDQDCNCEGAIFFRFGSKIVQLRELW